MQSKWIKPMKHTKTNNRSYKVNVLEDSVKFYLPRVGGYLEIVREMASEYGAMSLIEFDGYFEGKFEPVKYSRVEIHTNDINQEEMTEYANKIRSKLHQKSLALEYNNTLVLISGNEE
jgi:predicted lipase